MPGRFFLNALDPDKRTLAVPEPGRWKDDAGSQDFLAKYAADIHLEGQLKDLRVAHSVPSVFARPIQFYQALSNKANPLHDGVVAQWRGLLAIFALRKHLNLTLTVEKYVVPPEQPQVSNEGGIGGVGDQHFITMLRNQLPKPEKDWEEWWLLYCDDQLIGATSPWTVVYTPAEYSCPATIRWTDGKGLLVDPIAYYDPRGAKKSYELAILLRWIQLVREGERIKWGFKEHLEGKFAGIKRELEEWQTSLRDYRDEAVRVPTLIEQESLVSEPPYRYFLVPPRQEEEARAPASELVLAASKGEKTLVFSRSGVDPKMRVYGPVFADQVDVKALSGPIGEEGWTVKSGKEIPLPYLIAEEAFFPPKLAELKLSENALVRGTDKFATPLNPMFFSYFGHSTLKGGVHMLELGETQEHVIVRLRLPLADGKSGSLIVERKYDKQTEIVKAKYGPEETKPALAVWPDFYTEDWYENFAVYSSLKGTTLVVAPLLYDGRELGKTTEDGTQSGLRIWSSQEPPIGFALYHPEGGSGQGSGELIRCGLVLRDALVAPKRPEAGHKWRVAVDFGTSNTHVMIETQGKNPVALKFTGRTRLLTEAEHTLAESVKSGLSPDSDIETPFVTILATGDATVLTGERGSSQETVKDIPRFLFSAENAAHLAEVEGFYQNVKWGIRGGTIEEAPLRRYLRGLARYLLAEARSAGVGSLAFAWSYPLALPLGARHAMKAFWENLLTAYSDSSTLKITEAAAITESEALCRCLAAMTPPLVPVRSEALSVAVDVGGGSSDIGFWRETTLIDSVSFKLAGNNLLEPLSNLAGFVSGLYRSCTGIDSNDSVEKAFKLRPGVMFNALLSQAKDASGKPCGSQDPYIHPFVQTLFTRLPYGQPPWSTARSLIYLFFTGLAFYIGLHARKHVTTTMPEAGLYFGGRGSSLLAWVAGQREVTKNILGFAFKEGLARDAERNRQVAVEIFGPAVSSDVPFPPKAEVATGLLSSALKKGEVIPRDRTIVGEVGWARPEGTELAWDADVGAEMMYRLKLPPTHERGYMAQFLASVLPKYVPELTLDERNLSKLTVDSSKWKRRVQCDQFPPGT